MLDLTKFIDAISQWEGEATANSGKGAFKVPIDQFTGKVIYDYVASSPGVIEQTYKELLQREDCIRKETGYNLPLGLVCLAGPGFSGKSTYATNLIRRSESPDAFKKVSMGEVGSVLPFSLTVPLAYATQTDQVVVVDSWKDVWNDWHFSNTALQTGGIYTSLTAFLGQLSQALFLAGKTMIVIFNPQTSGERETVYQMLNTQCAGMIRLSGSTLGKVDYAQGRSLVKDYSGPFSRAEGLPVTRELIFGEMATSSESSFSSIFTKPII